MTPGEQEALELLIPVASYLLGLAFPMVPPIIWSDGIQ